jgi:hypothetical protein
MNGKFNYPGPAFPVMPPADETGRCAVGYPYPNEGMSLREYFAAKAMHAELMTCGKPGKACDALVRSAKNAGRSPEEQIAWNAYQMADAMLVAREVKP